MNTDAAVAACERVVTHIEHSAARRDRLAEQTVDAAAGGYGGLIEAQLSQHRKTGRLDDQPGAKRPWRLEPFEQHDAMAIAREEQGACEAGDAASRDGDHSILAQIEQATEYGINFSVR